MACKRKYAKLDVCSCWFVLFFFYGFLCSWCCCGCYNLISVHLYGMHIVFTNRKIIGRLKSNKMSIFKLSQAAIINIIFRFLLHFSCLCLFARPHSLMRDKLRWLLLVILCLFITVTFVAMHSIWTFCALLLSRNMRHACEEWTEQICDAHTHTCGLHASYYIKRRIEKDKQRARNQMNWQQIWCGHHWPYASSECVCVCLY